MRISLTVRGGLAAGMRPPPFVVDSTCLPDDKGRELEELVAAIESDSLETQTKAAPNRVCDGMTYVIAIEEGGESKTIRQTDLEMTESFSKLMAWVERVGEADPR